MPGRQRPAISVVRMRKQKTDSDLILSFLYAVSLFFLENRGSWALVESVPTA
jgi:hypothetical protein